MALGETDRVYDELLLTLVQAGDSRAAARLAARWQPRLMRTARRLLRDEEEAREAVQEAWAGIARGWVRLADPARFPAWAFGVLHHKCADRIRANRRARDRLGPPLDEMEISAPAATEDRTAIAQALETLGPDHREAAILYFGEGLTLEEVARATRTPLGTAKSRIFYARQRLKAALTGESDD